MEHIEKKQLQNERIEAFVQRLDSGQIDSVDFEENISRFFEINEDNVRESVKTIVYTALET